MAKSVVLSVGQTIGKLLVDESKFLWSVEDKVKNLQTELNLIRCLLRNDDARRDHNQVLGECFTQLQHIAYDAEDVIDQHILRVALKKEQNIIKAYACFVAKCKCVQAHVVGTNIDSLNVRISRLKTSIEAYGIQMVDVREREPVRASTLKRTYAHLEEDFVGREDSIKELVQELLKEHYRVISIWGIDGLGKTSLARKVLAQDEVKKHFNGFALVCISQEYHVKDILVEILVNLIPNQRERVMKMMDRELFETLHQIQQERRCIVVLDNIWTKQAWDNLQALFLPKNTRSKLLITTSNEDVAKYINPQGLFHPLRRLSDQESWDMLKRMFPETEEIAKDMKSLGYKLLKKCEGLPLAILVLGGLLAINEWKMVYEKINSHPGDENNALKVLALSYDNLPWHLRPCFLYLSSFPKDVEIPAKKIIHMWIAEGFVSSNENDEVEYVANQYLKELVYRRMVQARLDLSGNIKTCHLNNLMQDLCISKAKQESFLSIRNIQQDNEMDDCSSSMAIEAKKTCETRRLSLRASAKVNIIPSIKSIGRTMLHLRTLMFFGYSEDEWKQFQPIFIGCKFLRVLKLEHLPEMSGNLPKSVGDLVHLRLLSFAGSWFESLPHSLGNLVCLEFLDLHLLSRAKVTVPNVLWKMKRLRCLHLPVMFAVKEKFYGDQKKLRLDTLKRLRTLRNFCPENCDVKDVGKLTNLQKLTIIHCHELEIILKLAEFPLEHLQSLSFRFSRRDRSFTEGELRLMLSCRYFCTLSMHGKIEKLPEYSSLPQQLRKLVLLTSLLQEDPMPILEKLHHLQTLLLGFWAFVGKEMVCSTGGFPLLKHLLLFDLPNLEKWRVVEGAMPHLSRLGISRCPNLKTLPTRVSTYDDFGEMLDELRKHPDRGIVPW
ncbi:hypothetical protein BT93_G0601 [Corymbia citriodora subsp. variegata]|nr:hypothetical protein BT93_G0601 [Corymbia citriodora subsp. variegata]